MHSAQLTLRNVTKGYPGRTVLDDVSFTLKPGEKAGLIGDNGAGKSTLLRLIAGQERPDSGEVTVGAVGGVGYLPQTVPLPPAATVQDAVDLALADLCALEAELHRAARGLDAGGGDPGALAAYEELLARYEARDGYDADHRVDISLHHLGLPGLRRERPLGTLSGGERSRLALPGVLAGRPELLLLDEPTNDLDDGAVEWLETQLRAHRGTVLAVTHDRVFLERLTTTILEAEEGRITRYGDGYDGYRREGGPTAAPDPGVRGVARRAGPQRAAGRRPRRPPRRHPAQDAAGQLRPRWFPGPRPGARRDGPHPQRPRAGAAADRRPGGAAARPAGVHARHGGARNRPGGGRGGPFPRTCRPCTCRTCAWTADCGWMRSPWAAAGGCSSPVPTAREKPRC